MSKGLGKIERAILAAFTAEPGNAFTTEELIERVYAGVNRIEKKHRVSVIRSAKKLANSQAEISWMVADGLGGRLVFFSKFDVRSYAVGRLKTGWDYKPTDTRVARCKTEADIAAEISEGGRHYKYVVEDGAWWRHVRRWIAERDGETEVVADLVAKDSRVRAALALSIKD